MQLWPGQGYEYVENALFEKGPFNKRMQKQLAETQPPAVQLKELTAVQ